MKIAIFWNILLCTPYFKKRFGGTITPIFMAENLLWRWRWNVLPKRLFIYRLHGGILRWQLSVLVLFGILRCCILLYYFVFLSYFIFSSCSLCHYLPAVIFHCCSIIIIIIIIIIKKKLHGLSPRANYTDRATAASRRSVANLCG
jgi:hypothetical protein